MQKYNFNNPFLDIQIFHVHIDTRDFEKGNPWQTSTSTTYYSSKENLDVEEMKKTFITEDAVKKYIQ